MDFLRRISSRTIHDDGKIETTEDECQDFQKRPSNEKDEDAFKGDEKDEDAFKGDEI